MTVRSWLAKKQQGTIELGGVTSSAKLATRIPAASATCYVASKELTKKHRKVDKELLCSSVV